MFHPPSSNYHDVVFWLALCSELGDRGLAALLASAVAASTAAVAASTAAVAASTAAVAASTAAVAAPAYMS
ncbi:hypothetical protein CEP52_002789 [Fusarium oligoseptatum]|uniref:Uncharacterized protein n=1 Tax=Fusarium oligoseptatum TaxID=2604345 RepID=A0A428UC86_9HYPO|nr:hypothetical protein CEP52_002789 [Fusarium oligoseptatum]